MLDIVTYKKSCRHRPVERAGEACDRMTSAAVRFRMVVSLRDAAHNWGFGRLRLLASCPHRPQGNELPPHEAQYRLDVGGN